MKKNRGEHRNHQVAEALGEDNTRVSMKLRQLAQQGIVEKVEFGIYKFIPPMSNVADDMDADEEGDEKEEGEE